MTPIKRGTARRLGLDLPEDAAVYDEIDWSRIGVSMQDIERGITAWQRSVRQGFSGLQPVRDVPDA